MKRYMAGILLVLGCIPPFVFPADGYVLRVLAIALLFAAMGQAWNMVGGLANQMSLGHAGFFGIGAYASTLLLRNFGLTPWVGMLAGAVVAAVVAALLSLPTFRLRGHYFALATLAFGEVMRVIANSWVKVTGGPGGISVPLLGDSLKMLQFRSNLPYYLISLAAVVAVSLVFAAIKNGRAGYMLRAIKENPEAAEVIGIDTFQMKWRVFVLSAAFMAMLGTLYAQTTFFFDPETIFSLTSISIRTALVVIIGGIGLTYGPIIGALFLIPLEEGVNAITGGQVAGLSQLVFGLILIVVIVLEPRGLMAMAGTARGKMRGAQLP